MHVLRFILGGPGNDKNGLAFVGLRAAMAGCANIHLTGGTYRGYYVEHVKKKRSLRVLGVWLSRGAGGGGPRPKGEKERRALTWT